MGGDRQRPRTPIPPHCATRPAHPSPRPADELAGLLALPARSPSILCRAAAGAMDIPVDRAALAWALLTGDRARHEIEAPHRALGRRGRPGRCARGKTTGAFARHGPRSSTDGHGRPHPGMDEALIAVDSRRKRCGRDHAPGPNQRRCEDPAHSGTGVSPSRSFRAWMQPPPKVATSVKVWFSPRLWACRVPPASRRSWAGRSATRGRGPERGVGR